MLKTNTLLRNIGTYLNMQKKKKKKKKILQLKAKNIFLFFICKKIKQKGKHAINKKRFKS